MPAPGFDTVSPSLSAAPSFTTHAVPLSITVGSPVLGNPGVSRTTVTATGVLVASPLLGVPFVGFESTLPFPIPQPPPLPPVPFVDPYHYDRHVRRGGDDYAVALAALLPRGAAWPREPDTVLMALVSGLAQIWGQPVDARAADLLERESDPRATIELLPDWERNWGLPDPCFAEAADIAARQQMLVMKMTMLGGQSRAFFYSVAEQLGYQINITEFSPFMAGVSRVGDTHDLNMLRGDLTPGRMRWEIGAPEMRFYWTVHVGAVRLSWFRASSGQAGVDPHLRIALATDLECLIRRYAPAHTEVIFDYSGLGEISDPMAGTP